MKKSILVLAAVFTFSSFFTSCRETNQERNEVEINNDDLGDDLENAADDAGDAIERGANEVEEEIEGTDDY